MQSSVAGFDLVHVQYASVAHTRKPTHIMYGRPHAGSASGSIPGGRTLFLVNVPPDTTRGVLRDLFRKAGAIQSIVLHDFYVQKQSQDAQYNDDSDQDSDQDQAWDENPSSLQQSATKRNKSGPPRIQPLPSLVPNVLLTSGSSAHIIFLDESSLQRAMQLIQRSSAKPFVWPVPEKPAKDQSDINDDEMVDESAIKKLPRRKNNETRLVGLSFLLDRYRRLRPNHAQIKQHADSAIARYSWVREHPQWLLEQRRSGDQLTSAGVGIEGVSVGPDGELLDADGFTIVQKGNRYGRSGGEENTFAAITPEFEESMRENPDRKKKKELPDFYRFQFREKKRQQFAALRSQFESDKQEIAKRKAKMRFKPY
ncbi:hypothetical protein MYAM1_001538 [Malassezia yamatoensis]|uniref:Ribosomal RNA-processing protein 7 n=1 Tax=Malassezia yamatoensis TaxID=253288 RepID=A0AAJ5YS15_9BASI|nr:hypothetical protein MYAM1_001538 [Malassezia yamatoensis]